jgi:hypothetical protein
VGGHANHRFLVTQAKNRVAGPAHFERPGFLEILAFKEKLSAGQLVQKARGQHRRFMDIGFDPLVGG